MRRILTVLAVVWAGAAGAQQDAIEGTIRSQIDAFLVDDFATAFTFASPMIQGMFGTPDNFGAMVRNGYPMVWRPGDVTFLELREIGGRVWQKVLVSDASGKLWVLDYQMVEGADGWRINGVQILPAPEVGA